MGLYGMKIHAPFSAPSPDYRSIHCNINDTTNTNEEFQTFFLHKFHAWKGRNLFADGVVGPNGRLDLQRLLNEASLSIDKFKDMMVGAYVNCIEVTGHPLEPNAKYVSATYMKFFLFAFLQEPRIVYDSPVPTTELSDHLLRDRYRFHRVDPVVYFMQRRGVNGKYCFQKGKEWFVARVPLLRMDYL